MDRLYGKRGFSKVRLLLSHTEQSCLKRNTGGLLPSTLVIVLSVLYGLYNVDAKQQILHEIQNVD